MSRKTAIVIGAGPAGLTAARELLEKTDIKPIIIEMTGDIGGISKTVNYKGNRIDIGGHRFFSKCDRIMNYWRNILPLQGSLARDDIELGRSVLLSEEADAPDPEQTDRVMLLRSRVSRIFFMRKLFDYPLSLNLRTIANLGFLRTSKIGLSYLKARLFPIDDEKTLKDFLTNRFGKELYLTFFKDYTKKVWGVPCTAIPPEWGAQRIKGLSISKAIVHAAKNILSKNISVGQKDTETTLIKQFMYPKLGPGQLWEEVARIIESKGGEVRLHHQVIGIERQGDRINQVMVRNKTTGETMTYTTDYVFSSMPVRDLVSGLDGEVPAEVQTVAQGLVYRDFITVGLLLKEMKIKNETETHTVNDIIPDNWIYIQERDVQLGRLQIFNNWSPYMVKNENTVWIGLEYFCTEGDELWVANDKKLASFAIDELVKIDIIEKDKVLDYVVIRVPKAYPAYFGTYGQFNVIREYLDDIENLFLIGRNGMHRYNNQDHSMLTAMTAVDNIIAGISTKDNIWQVNTEQEYHEKK